MDLRYDVANLSAIKFNCAWKGRAYQSLGGSWRPIQCHVSPLEEPSIASKCAIASVGCWGIDSKPVCMYCRSHIMCLPALELSNHVFVQNSKVASVSSNVCDYHLCTKFEGCFTVQQCEWPSSRELVAYLAISDLLELLVSDLLEFLVSRLQSTGPTASYSSPYASTTSNVPCILDSPPSVAILRRRIVPLMLLRFFL
jgi:hypothetical protein